MFQFSPHSGIPGLMKRGRFILTEMQKRLKSYLVFIAFIKKLFLYCLELEDEICQNKIIWELTAWTRRSDEVVKFVKFATNHIDLLFIQLMLHLSHVKQMFCQTINFTQDLKSMQITRRTVYLTELPPWNLFTSPETQTVTIWHRLLAF